MLKTVFGAFDPTAEGRAILGVLNCYKVYTNADSSASLPMGYFYQQAAAALIDYNPTDDGQTLPQIALPYAYDSLSMLYVCLLRPRSSLRSHRVRRRWYCRKGGIRMLRDSIACARFSASSRKIQTGLLS